MPDGRPRFDLPVALGGYAWWYLDALSDDGRHALSIIAFVGSVFSPYYAAARARGAGNPLEHCALNVALYGPGARWSMTERGARHVVREREAFTLGPSALSWRGDALEIRLDEIAAPIPRRIRGRLLLHPAALVDAPVCLDGAGRHHWTPLAPCARIEVALDSPGWRWSGAAYLDGNAGDSPLEDAFPGWTWSRASMADGSTAVLYDAPRRDGSALRLARRFTPSGQFEDFDSPPACALPATGWRVSRSTRSDAPARVVQTLEDTPFYARSLVEARWRGETVRAMHESLSLDRFRSAWVRMLLPFRMPRRG